MTTSKRGTTTPGYVNRRDQAVLRATGQPGNDHNQRVYVLRCGACAHEYGANGSDIWQRRCPACDGGAPGLGYQDGVRLRDPSTTPRGVLLPIGDGEETVRRRGRFGKTGR